MRKLLYVIVILFTIHCSLFTISCSTIDCPLQSSVSVQYVVCNKDGKELALKDSLTVISNRQNGDTVVLNRLYQKSSFSLPISYSHPEDILFFHFKDNDTTVVDTVWLKKDDYPHFESVDCNAAFFHEITDVRHTQHYIDSLVLLYRSVNYDQTNIHFRLVPKSSD